jgi:hypothetical protein
MNKKQAEMESQKVKTEAKVKEEKAKHEQENK